ncbi:MAG: Zn-ribbon domain-containing OB-fold protein [Aquisalimonadaceae bacterium]
MSTSDDKRVAPPRNRFVDSEAFWRGTEEGKLMLQYCTDSGRFQHHPRPISLYTGKRNLEWRQVSGRGTIYAHTVLRTPSLVRDPDMVPVLLATIELDEGVRILGNILAAKPEEISVGKRVRLAWDEIAEGVKYPAFELDR